MRKEAWAQTAGTLRAGSPHEVPWASREPPQRLWLWVLTVTAFPSLAFLLLCQKQVGTSDSWGKSVSHEHDLHSMAPQISVLSRLWDKLCGRGWVSPYTLASAEHCVPDGLWCCPMPELTALGVEQKLCSFLFCGVVSTQPRRHTLAEASVDSPNLSSPRHTPGREGFLSGCTVWQRGCDHSPRQHHVLQRESVSAIKLLLSSPNLVVGQERQRAFQKKMNDCCEWPPHQSRLPTKKVKNCNDCLPFSECVTYCPEM